MESERVESPPSEEMNSESNPEIAREELEKQPKNDSSSSIAREDFNTGKDEEIVWHYLAFETELPSPAYLSHPPTSQQDENRNPPPECPNLKKYTSPFIWSEKRKATMVYVSCVATAFTAYNAGAYSSGLDQMTEEWHISRVAGLTGITTFTCGFGIAPMFLAPFSEINGRRLVFIVTGMLWVVFQIICAVTPTFGGELVARFFSGCMSSTFSTMVGGVISDIYHAKDRNAAMTIYSAGALFGTGFGPLISGFIAMHLTWRWIFYLQIIIDGVIMIFVYFLFKETRGSVLLSRKAKALNRYYDRLEEAGYYGHMMPVATEKDLSTTTKSPQRIRWKCLSDEERSSLFTMLRISLYRPFHMLLTEPVVFFFSLWISFSWAVLYMTFSAIPLIYQTTYGFNLQQTGAVFSAISIASIIFAFVSIYQEKLGHIYLPEKQRRILETPEGRLYFACAEAALLPIGCLWFCVAGAYPNVPWIVPTLGVGCATMGIFCVYLAVFNYLADTYHRYASSALAAQSFCRNMLAGAFPLFTTPMFHKMTFRGAGGFLGGMGFLLTTVPWVLLLFGPKIRAKSKLASEIMEKEKD